MSGFLGRAGFLTGTLALTHGLGPDVLLLLGHLCQHSYARSLMNDSVAICMVDPSRVVEMVPQAVAKCLVDTSIAVSVGLVNAAKEDC